jgi:hypothetical protein
MTCACENPRHWRFSFAKTTLLSKNDEWKKVAATLWAQVAQGEYVAPETLEEIYSKSNFIAQV